MNVGKGRLRAFGIHFSISVAIALIAAFVVFFVWYPYPYRELSGGRELFLILITVDVIIGPLLTAVIFNRNKSRRALLFDLSLISVMQLLALGYGLSTVTVVRPVHLVFEYDRFRVVHAADVPQSLLSKTPAGIEALPLTGPTVLSTRNVLPAEKADVVMAELGGLPIGARPDFWQPFEEAKAEVLAQAKPIAELKARFPAQNAIIEQAVATSGHSAEKLGYLPVVGRKDFWTALIDSETGKIVATIPLDPY